MNKEKENSVKMPDKDKTLGKCNVCDHMSSNVSFSFATKTIMNSLLLMWEYAYILIKQILTLTAVNFDDDILYWLLFVWVIKLKHKRLAQNNEQLPYVLSKHIFNVYLGTATHVIEIFNLNNQF